MCIQLLFLISFPGFFQLYLHVKAGFIAYLFLGVPEKTLNSSGEVCFPEKHTEICICAGG